MAFIAPASRAWAQLVLFGKSAATVHVETSGGTVPLNQNVTLDGFHSYTFAIPTATRATRC